MATLHVLSHSPFADSRLDSCLALMSGRDGLLLSGDAVYALQPGSAPRMRFARVPPAPGSTPWRKTCAPARCRQATTSN